MLTMPRSLATLDGRRDARSLIRLSNQGEVGLGVRTHHQIKKFFFFLVLFDCKPKGSTSGHGLFQKASVFDKTAVRVMQRLAVSGYGTVS